MHGTVTLLLGPRKGLSFLAGLENNAREMAWGRQLLLAGNSCSLLAFWYPESFHTPWGEGRGLGVGSTPRLIQTLRDCLLLNPTQAQEAAEGWGQTEDCVEGSHVDRADSPTELKSPLVSQLTRGKKEFQLLLAHVMLVNPVYTRI